MTAPRVVTFAVSLILVLAALASLYTRLPIVNAFVTTHRFGIVVVGYAILALGVVLRGL